MYASSLEKILCLLIKKGIIKSDVNILICPIDMLDRRGVEPRFIICNTAPNNAPGKHWTVLYEPEAAPSEYFDSLGNKPSPEMKMFISKRSGWKYHLESKKRIQPKGSVSCGLYCLKFIVNRCNNIC